MFISRCNDEDVLKALNVCVVGGGDCILVFPEQLLWKQLHYTKTNGRIFSQFHMNRSGLLYFNIHFCFSPLKQLYLPLLCQRWANSVFGTKYEYEYYSVSEIWPNTITHTIRVQKFGRIRIRILFGEPLLSKYEYEYLDYSNNTEYEYKK